MVYVPSVAAPLKVATIWSPVIKPWSVSVMVTVFKAVDKVWELLPAPVKSIAVPAVALPVDVANFIVSSLTIIA